ncbi:hypothetical protein G0Q06_01035 [Puniceicoccales bacterium CK1056]|uniref:Uncharacterized protein n=1 Tax=Oceanipulchritudo coccoides TaxID=2706888 RepID=A0A6B2LY81_9BACT|nr:hypothetical protein [Oceanipulchritudo coccoides]
MLVLLAAGCSSYAPVRPVETRTIALAPVLNESEVPQIIAPLSRNLREALNHSAAWQLVEPEEAEVLLRLTVLQLDRNAISRDPDDTGRPLSYYEELMVSILWESDLPPPWGVQPVSMVSASTVLYSQPSLTAAEAAAIGELAEEISRKIISRINWPAGSGQ